MVNKTTRKRMLGIALGFVMILAIASFVSVNVGLSLGFTEGYFNALNDVSEQTDLIFDWTKQEDGSYLIEIISDGSMVLQSKYEIHVWIKHERDGQLLSLEHHAGTLTTIGKNYIEQQISDTNASEIAKYVSCSDNATSPAAGWTTLGGDDTSEEIAANGLTRATGTYVSTGDGTWNVTKAFSVSGTQAVQLYGLQWLAASQSDNNLLCADTSAQKNCVNGDTLTVTWQVTVS